MSLVATWGYGLARGAAIVYDVELDLVGQPIEVFHICAIGGEKTMVSVTMKRHDRLPALRVVVRDKDTGDPIDFTGASSAKFYMKDENGTLIVDATAIIESPATEGRLRYDWEEGDTATEGEYRAEFELDYGVDGKLTVPNASDILVRVYEDLNNL
jgi:hypothetical protein